MNNNDFSLRYEQNNIDEIRNSLNQLRKKIYTKVKSLDVEYSRSKEPIPFCDKEGLTYKKLTVGESWGELFDCAWFHLFGNITKTDENIYLALDISGEALLYDKNGVPLKGFTNGSSAFDRSLGEPGKLYYDVTNLIENNSIDLFLDSGCNDLFGNLCDNGTLLYADLARKNGDIEELYYDFETCFNLFLTLSKDDKEREKIFNILSQVKNNIIYENKDWISNSKKLLSEIFALKNNNTHQVIAVGHSHLDLAWLWPIRETKRKALRTISNVIFLLEKYPDFTFSISQPQQLQWIKENSKELYSKIKYYESIGRIELLGGMWVESDTNLPGEESLVRQCLYGQKFYMEEFGHRVHNLWLPDVFGYSGALPQIIKKSDMDSFLTTKLSWSLINKFPYHNFLWQGIDGSEVYVHLPPEGTYNSGITPVSLHNLNNEITEQNVNESIVIYGIGDGGGGPGEEHLERLYRERDLYSLPKVRIDSVGSFFDHLKGQDLKIYKGELYLENHQGTYTSQSKNKWWNNFIESKLKAIESLMVSNNLNTNVLEDYWKEVLLYQFHDILPGSAIKRVYDESLKRYEVINDELDGVLQTISKDTHPKYKDGDHILNTSKDKVHRIFKNGDGYSLIEIAPFSSKIISKRHDVEYAILTNNDAIKTNDLEIRLSPKGYFSSIKFKGKELVLDKANALRVFKDFGDAWNILDHYRNQDEVLLNLLSQEIREYSDIYVIKQNYEYESSTVEQEMIIHKDTSLIDVTLNIDWHSLNRMLRCVSDFGIKTDVATADIQFGHLKRSRLTDTSINKAKFEVCAQKWMDISSPECGISIISHAKHGYYIKNNTLDLNLLRSTNYPCVDGDIGHHTINYSFFIHEGDSLLETDIVAEEKNAYLIYSSNDLHFEKPIDINDDEINISATKTSDDDNGVIVRLYNRTDKPKEVAININKKYKHTFETNLLEDVISESSNMLAFGPFEVKTLLLEP